MRLFKTLVFALSLLLAACHQGSSKDTIKVGTIAGPETTLMSVAKDVAKARYGLNIDIVPFSDYIMPNAALSDGNIDANVFQHEPYLRAAVAAQHYKFAVIGKTFVYPMGIYSKNLKSIKQIPEKATIAVPNDPSNEARALLLLNKAGLITLKDPHNINATVNDIAKNPKNITIKELDAAQLPRILPDVAAAVINTTYASASGLLPKRDSIYLENKDSPYANIIVVRNEDKDRPQLQQLVKALNSPEVAAKAKELFQDQAIAAWH